MKSLIFLSSLCIIYCTLFLLGSGQLQQKQEGRFACLNNLSNLPVPWIDAPQSSLKYAENSSELPAVFQNQSGLTGHGIKYWAPSSAGVTYAIRLNEVPSMAKSPMFLYIKYYTHIEGNEKETGSRSQPPDLVVVPAQDSDSNGSDQEVAKSLELTSSFKWADELIPLRSDTEFVVQLVVRGFQPNDVLLIQDLILSQGNEINSITDITKLCE